MVTRRQVLIGGALTLVVGDRLGLCAQGLGRPRRTTGAHGCILHESYASPFMETSEGEQLFSTGTEAVIGSSGDCDFDFALAQTLARISDFFDVLPGFGFYDDYDAKNAYATRAVRAGRGHGTVLFGQRLLKELLALRESPDAAVAAVCAHEFGHILQYRKNLDRIVGANQPTVKRIELQADYFAGFFAGIRKLEKPEFPAAVFAVTQFNLGDTRIAHQQHHGTPDERGAAITQGFNASFRNRISMAEAIEAQRQGREHAMKQKRARSRAIAALMLACLALLVLPDRDVCVGRGRSLRPHLLDSEPSRAVAS